MVLSERGAGETLTLRENICPSASYKIHVYGQFVSPLLSASNMIWPETYIYNLSMLLILVGKRKSGSSFLYVSP